MKMNRLALSVGVFVLVCALALAFLAINVARHASVMGASSGYGLVADFDNISGLRVRAPVRIAGVRVGVVQGIHMNPQTYQARVDLQMDAKIVLPMDSAASIMTEGLLGAKYVSIQPGFSEQMLGDQGQIMRTNSAMILENLIGKFLFDAAKKGGQR